MTLDAVWVFHGANAQLASAVFTSRSESEAWIAENGLSGMLTRYPLNISVYDWAIQTGIWQPTRDDHHNPEFMQRFTSAALEHFHYEHGQEC